ncbi:hypothetical protein BXZ70DRAFT_932719 [Cristinia sonorae]|uniref:Histone deacetylase interacting domain-containing protein n=1 Tax=Cristinia sonorae TaxID=1940300 RepID=A0A8K0UQS4_9AGAR|nr:hypothetical protein BXZ70DRAFT_932719 [Cristinia sonorae]
MAENDRPDLARRDAASSDDHPMNVDRDPHLHLLPQHPRRPHSSATLATRDEQLMVMGPDNGRMTPVDGGSLSQPESPERPLNVTDALSYLDSVKSQFQDHPDVYNKFLDIMKDFKSQMIDTPGVIDRVSSLFHGHPILIQGFNTFLPAGYRIECDMDGKHNNYITVTTPAGTSTQAIKRTPFMDAYMEGVVDETDMEPALAYLQKVKNRYSNDPERYQQFLELLSPHAAPSLSDDEVLALVGQIFYDDKDLAKGFFQFLPDRGVRGQAAARLDDVGKSKKDGEGKGKRRGEPVPAAPPVTAAQKRKRKAAEASKEKEKEVTTSGRAGPSKRTKQQHLSASEAPSPSLPQRHAAPASPRRAPHGHSQPQPLASTSMIVPQQPPPISMARYDDSQFFENVKRALGNRETYNEFLKLVNLFTQDIINTSRLVKESRTFLGDGELLAQFKEILGFDERRERFAQTEDIWTRPTGVLERPSRNQLQEMYGSYRSLPAHEINVTCSGRDEMCKSVLNDEWISQPNFATEDGMFVATKKNVYEEALHRSEEERHEYDFHIDAIYRTIQMLEPFNNKIAQLSPEERSAYKLKPNLAGAAKSIHLRVIKKIYGRDSGLDVFQAMQEMPAVAIPVVLTRLKQKHEEWKRAQREWNKVWREVDSRNYLKSLDHRGITFRAADKKAITVKAFVNQIEAARDEQMAKRAALIDPLLARTRPRHQLEYVIDDMAVLFDAIKLVFSFLDRTQGQINFAERKRIESFVRSFVPTFFMLDATAFNASFVPRMDGQDGEMGERDSVAEDADVPMTTTSKPAKGGRKSAANGNGDLRKRLLKAVQAKSYRRTRAQGAASASASSSRLPSPVAMQVDGEFDANGSSSAPRKGCFYTNTTFYAIFRLLELLYSRLQLFKGLAAQAAAESPSSYQANPVADALGLLTDTTFLGDRASDPSHFYPLFLESCERLFDNEIEVAVFEDQVRYMFGVKESYKAFTIDKLIGALVKQVQNCLADAKSQELFDILRREREMASPTPQDYNNCRKNAVKVIGPDENLFRMDWLADTKTVTIQLLGKDDPGFDNANVLTERWQEYIESYARPEAPDANPFSYKEPRRPFLRRTLKRPPGDVEPELQASGNLSIRVCVRTYKLFYVAFTGEFLHRLSTTEEREAARKSADETRKQRKERLDKLLVRSDLVEKPSALSEALEGSQTTLS